MKKSARRILMSIGVLAIFGCGDPGFVGPGQQDFSTPLANGYFIHRTSAHEICVAPRGYTSVTPIIPAKVVELDHDNAFVIAKQQHLRRRSPGDPKDTYEEPDPGVFSYWILNLRQPQTWGPMTVEQFKAKRKELGVAPALHLRDVYDFRPPQ